MLYKYSCLESTDLTVQNQGNKKLTKVFHKIIFKYPVDKIKMNLELTGSQ